MGPASSQALRSKKRGSAVQSAGSQSQGMDCPSAPGLWMGASNSRSQGHSVAVRPIAFRVRLAVSFARPRGET